MSIFYKYHDSYPESILIRDFIGRVSVNDIIASWEFLLDNNLIHKEIKGIINNLLSCDLDMNLDSFHKLIDYLRDKKQLKGLKQAVVCNNPKIIVFPTLGEQGEQDLKIRPFSTEEAAVKWIVNL